MNEKRIRVFWSRVKRGAPHECWEWDGNPRRAFSISGFSAHPPRLAFMLSRNLSFLPDGSSVTHTCRNSKCCNPHHLSMISNEEKIWKFVQKGLPEDCWPWTRDRSLMVRFRFNGKIFKGTPFRAVYQMAYGEIDSSVRVFHKCRNSDCCNPAHLTTNLEKKERPLLIPGTADYERFLLSEQKS